MENFITKAEFRGIEKGIGKLTGKEWTKIKLLIDDKPIEQFDRNNTLSIILAENNVKANQVINAVIKPYVYYNSDTRSFEIRGRIVNVEI